MYFDVCKRCRYSFTVKASCGSGYFYRSRNGRFNINGIYDYADFIIGDKFASIKKTKEGRQLIQDLNSSFAACLFVSTISIIAMIIISSIANMGIAIEEPNTVNYPVYFLVCYLLVYSVSILIGIVIDIFNSGQTTLLDDNSNAE